RSASARRAAASSRLVRAAADAAAAQARSADAKAADVKAVEIDALDRKADPCVDFYQFACGSWVAKHPVPPDRGSYGPFAEVQDRNFAILRRILETPAPPGRADATDDRQKAAGYYAACVDEQKIEAGGVLPIAADLLTIDELVNPDDLPVLLA